MASPPTHVHDLAPFSHSHRFDDAGAPARRRALWWVTWITLATMAVELAAGYWAGSLALVADGWHMGTHALALGGAALAAHFAQRVRHSARFTFGGWKIEVLSAYTSGLLLLAVGVWIGIDAIGALRAPRDVAYGEALAIAVLGLAVNLVCAAILARANGGPGHHGHGHGHGHGHSRGHGHGHAHAHGPAHDHGHEHAQARSAAPRPRHAAHAAHAAADGGGGEATPAHDPDHPPARDHNFSAAYLHVVADAVTSLLAIGALAGGLWWGLGWLDPAVALLGAVVIGRWAVGVLRDSARALVDASAPPPLAARVRALIEVDGDATLADLHVWQVGHGSYAAALSVVADAPLSPQEYGARLAPLQALRHATIEVHRCTGAAHQE